MQISDYPQYSSRCSNDIPSHLRRSLKILMLAIATNLEVFMEELHLYLTFIWKGKTFIQELVPNI